MTIVSREAIFAALFAKVSVAMIGSAPAFVTTSRTVRTWADVQPQEQPALFQQEGRQPATTLYGQPTKWMFKAELIIYVHKANLPAGVTDVVTMLNNCIDAVVTAIGHDAPPFFQNLAPTPAAGHTSTGIVGDVRIVGEIETDEGRLGDQAVAIIPIEIQPLT